ncbi:translation initiation factor IF-2 [Alphaproteobacteria bacterium]|nr:translation initiation factor IF-2 [Alphaproteobacteria bacterium]
MSEAKDSKKDEKKAEDEQPKKLSLGKGTLSLKGSSGVVPSAGRANPNTVAVEVRRSKRTTTPPSNEAPSKPTRQSSPNSRLNSKELEARAKALEAAKASGSKKTMMPKRVTIDDAKRKREQAQAEIKAIEEAKAAEAEAASATNTGAEKRDDNTPESRAKKFAGQDAKPFNEEESVRDKLKKAEPKPVRRVIDRRNARMTVNQAINRDFERDRGPSMAAQKRAKEKARLAAMGAPQEQVKVVREVVLPEAITVQELSNRMAEPGGAVVKALMKLGVMVTFTETIDADTAELVIEEFGHKVKRVTDADVEIGMEGEDDKEEDLQPRPPVVTIMGHVDHGKTSLLDALRETDVVAGEAGGITQHIGAYQVTMKSGEKITFLDTPGHEAFTEMRARGANVTDIVVIVVSAEDSVMPQTIEAINHAKAAEVPIIIAINKIDLPAADPQKVKTELLQHEIVVEDMGGDVQTIEVSAIAKTNLDKLEEAILLQAEILELKANPDREAQGFVVEAKLEKGRGSVATVLIQKGTLRIGDIFVAGAEFGKVRALINDHGKQVKEATLGQPVEVLGLNATPEAGDVFSVVPDEAKAREISEYRQHTIKKNAAAKVVSGRTTMDDILLQKEMGEQTVLPIVIKTDVHGSLEAISGAFDKLTAENEDIAVQILHSGVGGITESDIGLAKASNCFVIGFNVRANAQARELAQKEGVDIRYYNVIYDVLDDAKAVLTGMLSPSKREEYLGQAQIKEVFNITKVGKVAGCVVSLGSVKRGAGVRLLRDDVVIHEGMLKTLKRHKDEVKEVKEGTECGMAFESYDDIKAGDVIECYEIIEEARTVT